jgi:hypothetical protein
MLTLSALELFRCVNGVRGVASDEINMIYRLRVDEDYFAVRFGCGEFV